MRRPAWERCRRNEVHPLFCQLGDVRVARADHSGHHPFQRVRVRSGLTGVTDMGYVFAFIAGAAVVAVVWSYFHFVKKEI